MSGKRSIFEEVGEGKRPVTAPAGGMIAKASHGARRAIRAWLMVLFGLVVVMIAVGGLTRLTDSGLSITEWAPITGAIPPLSGADWLAEFDKYRQIPEFELVNSEMTLEEFKANVRGFLARAHRRHLPVELATDRAYRVHHVAQAVFRVGHAERVDRRLVAYRALEARALALAEVQAETHRVGDGQDVGEQDRRIELVAPQRLHSHFAGEFGVAAQAHEVARLRPRLAVLGQVAARLAHDPDGRAVRGLAPQVLQEDAVLDVSHASQLQFLKVSATASTVAWMSSSVCAALTNPTSQPEGAR